VSDCKKHPVDRLAPAGRFDAVIECLLIGLLAFMPFALGVVQPWSEQVVLVLCFAMTVSLLLKLICHRQTGVVRTWAYLPAGAFVFIAALGLIPFPAAILREISPNTVALKTQLLSDLPDADSVLNVMTLSFYPDATRQQLRLLLAVAAVFFVVLNVYRQPRRIERLLLAISLIGGAVALLALAQNLFGNNKLYWLIATPHGQARSGPFVNHSHYAQFMNLSAGGAIGLLLVRLRKDFAGCPVSLPLVFQYLSTRSARLVWLLAAIISLAAATVFLSLSRGGMLSMLIAAAFTSVVLIRRRSLTGHGWLMPLVALAAFVCILYVGFEAVYDRLASLGRLYEYAGRWQMVKDLLTPIRQFPAFGTGLGSHYVVYPMFDRSSLSALATHAENEYVQVAEETGLAGLAVLALLAVMVWRSYRRAIRSSEPAISLAAYGLGFGLCAILLHSLTDFGQHLPGNAVLSSLFCAILVNLGKTYHIRPDNTTTPPRKPASTVYRLAVLLCISGVGLWAIAAANRLRTAERHWQNVLVLEKKLVQANWQADEQVYEQLLSAASRASAIEPGNIEYLYWLNVYRWHRLSRHKDPDTAAVAVTTQLLAQIDNIIEAFNRVRKLCPAFGPAYCALGQLQMFVLADAAGAEKIRTALRLAPCDPKVCFAAGLADLAEGMPEDSLEKFARAIEIDASFFEKVVAAYLYAADRPDLALAVAADNTIRLGYVVRRLQTAADNRYEHWLQQGRARLVALLQAKCNQPDAPATSLACLAELCRQQNDNQTAIRFYYRALAADHGQIQWRLALAELLAEIGQLPEAIRQARMCLRLCPQSEPARQLIQRFSVQSGRFDAEIAPLQRTVGKHQVLR
jgi:O-antigen ligase